MKDRFNQLTFPLNANDIEMCHSTSCHVVLLDLGGAGFTLAVEEELGEVGWVFLGTNYAQIVPQLSVIHQTVASAFGSATTQARGLVEGEWRGQFSAKFASD